MKPKIFRKIMNRAPGDCLGCKGHKEGRVMSHWCKTKME